MFRGPNEKEIGDQWGQYLQIALCIAILCMNDGNIRRECRYKHQWQACEWAGHGFIFGVQAQKICALQTAHRQKRYAELGCSQLLDNRMTAGIMDLHLPAFAGAAKVWRHPEILLETYIRFLYYIDGARGAEEVYVYAVGRPYHVQVMPSLAHKFSQQSHWLAPGQAPTDGNGHAILHNGCDLGQRHPLIFRSKNRHNLPSIHYRFWLSIFSIGDAHDKSAPI